MKKTKLDKPIDELIHTRSAKSLLRFLLKRDGRWAGNELARLTKLSGPSAHETLKKLKRHGLVRMEKVANTHVYTLNSQSALLPPLRTILLTRMDKDALLDSTVKNEVLNRMLSQDAIKSIVRFGGNGEEGGSSNGEGDGPHEVNLLIVVSDESQEEKLLEEMWKIKSSVRSSFGTSLAPVILTASSLKRMKQQNSAFLRRIMKQENLIYGEPLEQL